MKVLVMNTITQMTLKQVDASIIFSYSKNNMFMDNTIRCSATREEFIKRIGQIYHEVVEVENNGFIAIRNGAQEPHTVPISKGDLVYVTSDNQILAIERIVSGRLRYGICEHFN